MKIFLSFVLFVMVGVFAAFQLPAWLVVNETPAKSDAIVVLNGQNVKGRIAHGVSLYRKGLAPRLIISGLSELEKETGVCLQKVYAMALGVPEDAIEIQNQSESTYEDALYIQRMLEEKGYKSFILVTSPLHTRRSKILFEKNVSPEIRWSISCETRSGQFKEWWNDVRLSREVFYELLALPYCLLRKQ